MPKVKFLSDIYLGGEVRFRAGNTCELDPDLSARYSRRGWCKPVTEDDAPSESAGGGEAGEIKPGKRQK